MKRKNNENLLLLLGCCLLTLFFSIFSEIPLAGVAYMFHINHSCSSWYWNFLKEKKIEKQQY